MENFDFVLSLFSDFLVVYILIPLIFPSAKMKLLTDLIPITHFIWKKSKAGLTIIMV